MAIDYGKCMFCTDALRTGRLVSGVEVVAQSSYRRIITPRGALRGGEDERNFGLDLVGEIGKDGSEAGAAVLRGKIRAELLKDERVSSVDVSIAREVKGASVTFVITVSAYTDEGPFQLVMKADQVQVELLGIFVGGVQVS